MRFEGNGAELSDCGHYRYKLWRVWDAGGELCLFVMLNPSTADARNDDATIRRCIDYAKRWGYGGLLVGNLFAYRSTDPTVLQKVIDPIGPANDAALVELHQAATLTVAAWGNTGGLRNRDRAVRRMLAGLSCLRINRDGSPAHPVRLPKNLTPVEYR